MEAGEYASQLNKENSQNAENEVLEQLKADGVKIVEVPDVTPWQEAVKGVIEDNTKGQEELYQKILDPYALHPHAHRIDDHSCG